MKSGPLRLNSTITSNIPKLKLATRFLNLSELPGKISLNRWKPEGSSTGDLGGGVLDNSGESAAAQRTQLSA